MNKTAGYVFTVLMIKSLALLEGVRAEPRAQIVNMTCNPQREHNTTLFVPNFIALMERISDVLRQFGWGTAVIGSGLDANYGLAQCYGDLSLTDCPLCYAEARTVLPECYPSNGGRVFLDKCFVRSGNYSFYEEYLGPNDMVVCGNASRKGSDF
ncbi:Cysteine-rich RLK 3 isoform 1 [Hibiscus syriacus]|uniref:Cysteine-rich RLK 3 isoform 1 n=1 Tax=Hibiscus syriacus TaxID=106335 RepID=A0A6A2WCQ0_HIBSY|nr:Cysteine-rich RLK 3 isoform 1 [Hibiscus syriacus]